MELRGKLKHGDMKILASIAGVALSTVEKTVYGTRNNAKVKEAAQLLIESREKIAEKFVKQNS